MRIPSIRSNPLPKEFFWAKIEEKSSISIHGPIFLQVIENKKIFVFNPFHYFFCVSELGGVR